MLVDIVVNDEGSRRLKEKEVGVSLFAAASTG